MKETQVSPRRPQPASPVPKAAALKPGAGGVYGADAPALGNVTSSSFFSHRTLHGLTGPCHWTEWESSLESLKQRFLGS